MTDSHGSWSAVDFMGVDSRQMQVCLLLLSNVETDTRTAIWPEGDAMKSRGGDLNALLKYLILLTVKASLIHSSHDTLKTWV